MAGWPVARQHPKGQDGTVFVTIEDETGGRAGSSCGPGYSGKAAGSWGAACSWSGEQCPAGTGQPTSSPPRVRSIHSRAPMPAAHDWH